MKLNLNNVGDVAVVVLENETITDQKFNANISPVLEKYKKLIFDMNQVRAIDSHGCGALLACLRKLDSYGGELKLCSVSIQVRTLFELIRIHRLIEMFNSREEAINSYQYAFSSH